MNTFTRSFLLPRLISYANKISNQMKIEILNQNELMRVAEVKQQSKLIHWLNENNIAFKFTKKRHVFTTSEQLNKSFSTTSNSPIEFGL